MEYAVRLYHKLARIKIHCDGIILYGSQANGTAHKDSDIDFAVISRNFGKSKLRENILVNTLASEIDTRISAVTYGVDDFYVTGRHLPLRHEIMTKGISLI
jgi:predicted nucleotidyltransferase